MNGYTAKQITELLQQDEPEINLRTVRYYTQIGIVPPLELAGNKRVYTDKHLHYFRAVLTLSKTGETLAAIQERLKDLPLDEIKRIGESMDMYRPERVLENETVRISDDVYITMGPQTPGELKRKIIAAVSDVMKGENRP
ncbi:MerR family transcriptional regulator [Paenibacillus elgii]|uniref:MerR family transcriptional regulator n=1 Tax=Paenibacillus elgii TaxID=189691 RepID=UPI0013D35226|nr:MerR family transcriptional regulator [Paenibacillus elgii]